MATLIQFSKNIRKRGSQIQNAGTRMVKAGASRTLTALVMRSPVKTGKLVSNWRVGIGGQTRAVIKPYSPGKKGETASANRSAALANGLARIKSVRGTSGVGLETAIYINNNTPYLGIVNSKPPHAGFVEAALQEARAEITAIRIFV